MNKVAYFEIHAEQPERAVNFYKEIFSWEFIKDESMPIEYYRIEGAGIFGAILKRPGINPHMGMSNAFVVSVEIDNFDKIAARILELGGVVALEKFAILGKCWQGYFIDTEGNTFGIFQVDENAA